MGKRGKQQSPEIRRILYMEALAFDGWFKASALYYYCSPPSATAFLNSLITEGEMESDIIDGYTMYRWIN